MFKFKKIASILASVALTGSTMFLASAANYPAPFVQGGSPNVAVIYGSHTAASVDLAAAFLVSDNLNSHVSSTGGTTASGGDYVLLEKSSDKINLRDNLATVFGSSVDEGDLGVLLADGIYSNDENTEYDYEQKITLGAGLQQNFFASTDYDPDETPTIGINLTSDQFVLNYTINFIDRPESDVSGGDLVDFETTTLRLLGRDYFILDADNSTNIKLTMLDTANSATISEGERKTLSVGSKTYEAAISFIGTSEVKLSINGEVTNSLAEGGTQKLSDGSYVGIKDISVQDYQGGVKQVEFSIGNGKIEATSGSDIKVNDDTIDGLKAFITRGSMSGSKETISKIAFQWTTDDEEFITAESDLEMPGFKAVKFTADDFVKPAQEKTVLKNSGSGKMLLTTMLDSNDGEITIPLLYSSSQDLAGIGESATKQVFSTNETTAAGQIWNDSIHDWMVASWNSTKDHESYVLRFTSFSQTSGVNYTTVQKLTSSGWVSACADRSDSSGSTDCDVGSLTLTLNKIDSTGKSVGRDYVNFTGNAGSSFNKLYTAEGLEINFPFIGKENSTIAGSINFTAAGNAGGVIGNNASRFSLVVRGEDKDGTLGIGATVKANVTVQTDNDIEVSSVLSLAADSKTFSDPDPANDDDLVGIAVGAISGNVPIEFWRKGSSSSQRNAELIYYGDESYGQYYLTAPNVVLGGGAGTGGTTVGVPLLDTEVSQASGKNIIVVGGSCVNSVAASLLGSSSPLCGNDFTSRTGVGANEFLIQTFERTGGKVATLVAGYEAGDTQNAARSLTTQEVMTDIGKKYTGTNPSSITLVS